MEFSSEFGGAVGNCRSCNGNTVLEGWGYAMVEARGLYTSLMEQLPTVPKVEVCPSIFRVRISKCCCLPSNRNGLAVVLHQHSEQQKKISEMHQFVACGRRHNYIYKNQ